MLAVSDFGVAASAIALAAVLVYVLRDNTAQLWKAVGELTRQNKEQGDKIDVLQADVLRLDGENTSLKLEVNELCRELGRPPRHFVTTPRAPA